MRRWNSICHRRSCAWDVAQPEERVHLAAGEHVRNRVGVTDDLDRRRQAGDQSRSPSNLRQRSPQIAETAGGGTIAHQESPEQNRKTANSEPFAACQN